MIAVEGAGVTSARTGSRTEELYRRHVAGALRLAYLMTGDRAVAEDVVQDSFVRLFGRFEDLRKPDAFGAYLHRTVVNVARDHFRKVERERRAVRLQEHEEGRHETGRVDAHDELLHALQDLPPRQRAAVVLRYCEGLSETETADVLGTTAGAVNSLVARGLAGLRRVVGGAAG